MSKTADYYMGHFDNMDYNLERGEVAFYAGRFDDAREYLETVIINAEIILEDIRGSED